MLLRTDDRFVLRFSGGSLNHEELDLDGHDVWRAISNGEASPRSEILHNIDIKSVPESELGFAYQGIGLRLGDMKLLMGVPNISYFIPPEDRRSTQTNKLSPQDLEDVRVKSITLTFCMDSRKRKNSGGGDGVCHLKVLYLTSLTMPPRSICYLHIVMI